jgi:hypothetical protein
MPPRPRTGTALLFFICELIISITAWARCPSFHYSGDKNYIHINIAYYKFHNITKEREMRYFSSETIYKLYE